MSEPEKIAGQTIKRLIKEKGITQKYLARQLEVSDSLVSKILAGESVLTVKALVKIAELLGVEPADLLPSTKSVREKPAEYGVTDERVREICREEIRKILEKGK